MLGSASAPPSGLRSSRTQHPQHQRPKGGPKQTAEVGQAKLPNSLLGNANYDHRRLGDLVPQLTTAAPGAELTITYSK